MKGYKFEYENRNEKYAFIIGNSRWKGWTDDYIEFYKMRVY